MKTHIYIYIYSVHARVTVDRDTYARCEPFVTTDLAYGVTF